MFSCLIHYPKDVRECERERGREEWRGWEQDGDHAHISLFHPKQFYSILESACHLRRLFHFHSNSPHQDCFFFLQTAFFWLGLNTLQQILSSSSLQFPFALQLHKPSPGHTFFLPYLPYHTSLSSLSSLKLAVLQIHKYPLPQCHLSFLFLAVDRLQCLQDLF